MCSPKRSPGRSSSGTRSTIADVLQAIRSDEDAHVLIYVEEALCGHAILNVYACTSEQVERVKDIVVDHLTSQSAR